MNKLITLTTDFGLSDSYVASVKGVILGVNPQAAIIDICNTIKPQNIAEAAFVLGTAYRYFPAGTIHLVVVDPGVGTDRRAVILRTPAADFIGPDNGLFSFVLDDFKAEITPGRTAKLGEQLKAVSIANAKYWHEPVSSTFHGRDIFAPVAAHLSLGTPLDEFGPQVQTLQVLPHLHPHKAAGHLVGNVIHVDNFGNLITNIKEQDLPGVDKVSFSIGGVSIHGLSRTYAESEGLLALLGSAGYVEISLKNGSAAGFLGIGTGDQVKIS